MISSILSTDMVNHFSDISKVKARLSSEGIKRIYIFIF